MRESDFKIKGRVQPHPHGRDSLAALHLDCLLLRVSTRAVRQASWYGDKLQRMADVGR